MVAKFEAKRTWKEDEVNQRLDRSISNAFSDVYETHDQYTVNMRKASTLLAIKRVVEATNIRGIWP